MSLFKCTIGDLCRVTYDDEYSLFKDANLCDFNCTIFQYNILFIISMKRNLHDKYGFFDSILVLTNDGNIGWIDVSYVENIDQTIFIA